MIFVGIDPGFSGAVAFYQPASETLNVFDMPVFERTSGRREVDAHILSSILLQMLPALAVVEDVGAMTYIDAAGKRRGQGAAASFAFGKSYGVVVGVLAGLRVPTIPTKPAVWKSMMKLSSDKSESLRLAIHTFPKYTQFFTRATHDGRAEAALLAKLASQLHQSPKQALVSAVANEVMDDEDIFS